MATAISSDLLSREEAANYLGLKPQTLAKWASAGTHGLRFFRVGTRCKYRKADLDAWLESRVVGDVDGE